MVFKQRFATRTAALLLLLSPLSISGAAEISRSEASSDVAGGLSYRQWQGGSLSTEFSSSPLSGLSGGGFVAEHSLGAQYRRNVEQRWRDVLGRARADTFGAAVDEARARKILLEYLNGGKVNASADEWRAVFADLPLRLSDQAVEEALSLAESKGGKWSFIRTLDLDYQTSLGNRPWSYGVNILGRLRETDKNAAAWQVRAYGGEDSRIGGNVGLIWRWNQAGDLFGANAFLDYEDNEYGDFWRWSLGVEARSEWLDFTANRYWEITDEQFVRRERVDGQDRDIFAYTQGGYDLGLEFYWPGRRWISGGAEYYWWEGKRQYGHQDDEGVRYGLALGPLSDGSILGGFKLRLEYDRPVGSDTKGDWGGAVSYSREFSRPAEGVAPGKGKAFQPADYFFAPVRREYSQRIRLAVVSLSAPKACPSGRVIQASEDCFEAVIRAADFSRNGEVVVTGDNLTATVSRTISGDNLDIDSNIRGTVRTTVRADFIVNFPLNITIATNTDARLSVVRTVDGRWTLSVAGDTTVDFSDDGEQLNLQGGTVFLDRGRRGGLNQIIAGRATVDLLGTQLTVGYDGTRTTVDLLEGQIRVNFVEGDNNETLDGGETRVRVLRQRTEEEVAPLAVVQHSASRGVRVACGIPSTRYPPDDRVGAYTECGDEARLMGGDNEAVVRFGNSQVTLTLGGGTIREIKSIPGGEITVTWAEYSLPPAARVLAVGGAVMVDDDGDGSDPPRSVSAGDVAVVGDPDVRSPLSAAGGLLALPPNTPGSFAIAVSGGSGEYRLAIIGIVDNTTTIAITITRPGFSVSDSDTMLSLPGGVDGYRATLTVRVTDAETLLSPVEILVTVRVADFLHFTNSAHTLSDKAVNGTITLSTAGVLGAVTYSLPDSNAAFSINGAQLSFVATGYDAVYPGQESRVTVTVEATDDGRPADDQTATVNFQVSFNEPQPAFEPSFETSVRISRRDNNSVFRVRLNHAYEAAEFEWVSASPAGVSAAQLENAFPFTPGAARAVNIGFDAASFPTGATAEVYTLMLRATDGGRTPEVEVLQNLTVDFSGAVISRIARTAVAGNALLTLDAGTYTFSGAAPSTDASAAAAAFPLSGNYVGFVPAEYLRFDSQRRSLYTLTFAIGGDDTLVTLEFEPALRFPEGRTTDSVAGLDKSLSYGGGGEASPYTAEVENAQGAVTYRWTGTTPASNAERVLFFNATGELTFDLTAYENNDFAFDPTRSGRYVVTVEATDADATAPFNTVSLSLTVEFSATPLLLLGGGRYAPPPQSRPTFRTAISGGNVAAPPSAGGNLFALTVINAFGESAQFSLGEGDSAAAVTAAFAPAAEDLKFYGAYVLSQLIGIRGGWNERAEYVLTVRATDPAVSGRTATAFVTVHYDDYPLRPRFDPDTTEGRNPVWDGGDRRQTQTDLVATPTDNVFRFHVDNPSSIILPRFDGRNMLMSIVHISAGDESKGGFSYDVGDPADAEKLAAANLAFPSANPATGHVSDFQIVQMSFDYAQYAQFDPQMHDAVTLKVEVRDSFVNVRTTVLYTGSNFAVDRVEELEVIFDPLPPVQFVDIVTTTIRVDPVINLAAAEGTAILTLTVTNAVGDFTLEATNVEGAVGYTGFSGLTFDFPYVGFSSSDFISFVQANAAAATDGFRLIAVDKRAGGGNNRVTATIAMDARPIPLNLFAAPAAAVRLRTDAPAAAIATLTVRGGSGSYTAEILSAAAAGGSAAQAVVVPLAVPPAVPEITKISEKKPAHRRIPVENPVFIALAEWRDSS